MRYRDMPSLFFAALGVNLLLNGNWMFGIPMLGVSLALSWHFGRE